MSKGLQERQGDDGRKYLWWLPLAKGIFTSKLAYEIINGEGPVG